MDSTLSYDDGRITSSPGIVAAIILSLLLHSVLIFLFIIKPEPQRRKIPANYMSVSMVSMPSGSGSTPRKNSSASQKTNTEKSSEQRATPKAKKPPSENATYIPDTPKEMTTQPPSNDAVSIRPKVSMKKKTYQTDKLLKTAIKKIEKRVDQGKGQERQKASALDRIKKRVQAQEAAGETFSFSRGKGDGVGDGNNAGPGGLSGQELMDTQGIYQLEVASQVHRQWAFPAQLTSDSDELLGAVIFKVMPDGEIRDILFTQRSGNENLDDSIHKALRKASPVSPHPAGMIMPFMTMGLRYNPQGVVQ